ncbi:polysaccharide deacetylase family protein [Bacillus xiapuensis]|uniref:polysaccharide deacetylase family protein n=1 Tax=Bacillus xiapuensis TaxID=2014075 RepID=UPI000C241639|nr:polysaccharide deacetylase family protein [Bacillus xiapuensis]
MRKRLFTALISIILCTVASSEADAKIRSREEYEKSNNVIWDIQTDEKIVAFTFDDGPHPLYTVQLLNVLAKYNAKATFFVSGIQARKYPFILRRQIKEGHELANHTFSHTYNAKVKPSFLKKELAMTNDIIYQATGFRPSLYRPVGGLYNDRIIHTAAKAGYQVVLWSWHQDTLDWKKPNAKRIAHQVIKGTRPGNIILMHDSGGNRSQTVQAVEKILRQLSKEGYEFVTVSEMIYRSQSILPSYFPLIPR